MFKLLEAEDEEDESVVVKDSRRFDDAAEWTKVEPKRPVRHKKQDEKEAQITNSSISLVRYQKESRRRLRRQR